MILSKIQLGGCGGSLLNDNVMNLRKIAIIAAVVLTGDGKLHRKARTLLNYTDTESELKLGLSELKFGKVHSTCMEKVPALAVM